MKVHGGVSRDSGLIKSDVATADNAHDQTAATDLLHGHELVLYTDAGNQGIAKRPEIAGKATEFRAAMRADKSRPVPEMPEGIPQDLIEVLKAHIQP